MNKPPLERAIVKQTLTKLRARGGFWIKVHGSPFQLAGIPDILGCYRGRFIAFEVKREVGLVPTRIQAYQMEKIRAAGGFATLIFTAQQALDLLDRIDAAQEARQRNHQSPPR
jgi:Holliday junction resolvase